MGRHIDHQGGNCNLMTTDRELMGVFRRRSDDLVTLHNVDHQRYPGRRFSIGELTALFPQTDWLALVNSPQAWSLNREAAGDWAQYFRAAALRLQKAYPHMPLCGMDILLDGSIPPAAGLSSSSALVVLAAKALMTANQLQIAPERLVELCGEGEWFVGTRGGSADHAAIILGEKNRFLKVTFFDFAVEQKAQFPSELLLVVCDSGIQAKKTAGARDQFNHRVACYRLGLMLIRRAYPQYAGALQHLRDINIRRLGISLAEVYRILLSLPENANRDDLCALLEGHDLQSIFSTHAPPPDGNYPLRGVVLYGLAECERSRLFAEVFGRQDFHTIGRLMNTSHDGDRVVRYTVQGEMLPYQAPTSDRYLEGLIADLESGDPQRAERAGLEWQPGSYRCSLPEIDRMVDLALQVPGVIGAQLAGAGLGGSIMVLVQKDSAEELRQHLVKSYYQPAHIQPGIFFCTPTAGSSVLFDQPNQKIRSRIEEELS